MKLFGLLDGRLAAGAAAVVLTLPLALGCGTNSPAPPRVNHDAADGPADGAARADAVLDAKSDAPGDVACGTDSLTKKSNGQSCKCASDCASNFCVDGLCCNAACTESCKTCAGSGSMGTCTFIAAGKAPRELAACQAADVATCGWGGTCHSAGACLGYT